MRHDLHLIEKEMLAVPEFPGCDTESRLYTLAFTRDIVGRLHALDTLLTTIYRQSVGVGVKTDG